MKNYKFIIIIVILCITSMGNEPPANADVGSIWDNIYSTVGKPATRLYNIGSGIAKGVTACGEVGAMAAAGGFETGPGDLVIAGAGCAIGAYSVYSGANPSNGRSIVCSLDPSCAIGQGPALKTCAEDPTQDSCSYTPSPDDSDGSSQLAHDKQNNQKTQCSGTDAKGDTPFDCYCPNGGQHVYKGDPLPPDCSKKPQNNNQAINNAQSANSKMSGQTPTPPPPACVYADNARAPQGGCYCPQISRTIPQGVYMPSECGSK